MIVSNNPEINVDEIMLKIRAEIANRKGIAPDGPIQIPSGKTGLGILSTDWTKVASALSIADQNADICNRRLTMAQYPRTLRWLARLSGRIVVYLSQVVTFPQRKYNLSLLQATEQVTNSLKRIESRLINQNHRLAVYEEQMLEKEQQVSYLHTRLTQHDELISVLQEKLSRTQAASQQIRKSTVQQEHRLGVLLQEIRKGFPDTLSQGQVRTFEAAQDHLLDSFYLNLEDRFRGSRKSITDRFSVYLPYVKESLGGEADRSVLDLGCGRGEWLELLRQENLNARGVDLNVAMVAECRNRQIDVVQSDVFEHLQSLPDESVGAVSAFHLIEHLPFRAQITLMDEAVRVLKVGGVAIFETPNPENLQVSSCYFYLDPTHKRPLPPSFFNFMAEQRGLSRVEILRLHPFGQEAMITQDGSELAAKLNHLLYGPQDYAVIGYKK